MRVILGGVLSVRVINCQSKMELMVVYHLQKVLVSVLTIYTKIPVSSVGKFHTGRMCSISSHGTPPA